MDTEDSAQQALAGMHVVEKLLISLSKILNLKLSTNIFFCALASRNIHQICDLLSGDFTEYFGVYQGQESNIYTDQHGN